MEEKENNIGRPGGMKSIKGKSLTLTPEKIQAVKEASSIHRWLLMYLRKHWTEIWRAQSPNVKYVVVKYIGDNGKTPKPDLFFFRSKKRAMKSLVGDRHAMLKYRFPDRMELMI